jgi:hypothetical protein
MVHAFVPAYEFVLVSLIGTQFATDGSPLCARQKALQLG